MFETNEIAEIVEQKLKKSFPYYPLEISGSADDENTLCVHVFAVPEEIVESVEDIIFDIQDEIDGESKYLLLPMVRDIETTRHYYKQYSTEPQDVSINVNQMFEVAEDSGWKELEIELEGNSEEESLDIKNIEHCIINAGDEYKEMQQVDDTRNASNDEDLSRAA